MKTGTLNDGTKVTLFTTSEKSPSSVLSELYGKNMNPTDRGPNSEKDFRTLQRCLQNEFFGIMNSKPCEGTLLISGFAFTAYTCKVAYGKRLDMHITALVLVPRSKR